MSGGWNILSMSGGITEHFLQFQVVLILFLILVDFISLSKVSRKAQALLGLLMTTFLPLVLSDSPYSDLIYWLIALYKSRISCSVRVVQ